MSLFLPSSTYFLRIAPKSMEDTCLPQISAEGSITRSYQVNWKKSMCTSFGEECRFVDTCCGVALAIICCIWLRQACLLFQPQYIKRNDKTPKTTQPRTPIVIGRIISFNVSSLQSASSLPSGQSVRSLHH